jgi:predicted aspartyl protease
MKSFPRFIIGSLVICFLYVACASSSIAQSGPSVIRGEVPFKLFGGYLVAVEGRIGDHNKLKFVLDTGVTHSVIGRKLAERLSGPRSQSGKVLSLDKQIRAKWVEVPEIEFGPIHVSNFSMMIGDLKYFQSFATQVDAVIGLDVLRLSSFSIDYETHQVIFGSVTSPSSVPMDIGELCLTVEVMVGDSKLRLLVDTGAPALVLYEDRLAGRLPQFTVQRETFGIGMAGWVHSKQAFIRNATLGSAILEGTVFLVNSPSSSFLANVDGYLGTAALKAHRLDFNFETRTLGWKG